MCGKLGVARCWNSCLTKSSDDSLAHQFSVELPQTSFCKAEDGALALMTAYSDLVAKVSASLVIWPPPPRTVRPV